jgi:uncharacterized membrane protein
MPLLAHGGTGPSGGAFPPWEWHPATVHFPIAFLLGAVALDLYAWWRARADLARTATGLMAAGVITGVVAAATGAVAFFTVPAHTAEAHTLMYWHLGVNAAALGLFAAVVFLRRHPEPPGAKVRVAGLLAAALLAAGGFLGGRIVYRGGAGVDPAILAPEVRDGHTHERQPGTPRPEKDDPQEGH